MESLPQHLFLGFAGGLLSFAHCLGMCGGFILHLSLSGPGRRSFAHQFLWLVGKTFSYLFLGAATGYAGAFLGDALLRHEGQFQNLLSFATGGIILLMGLTVLGLVPVRGKTADGLGGGLLVGLSRTLLTGRSPGGTLLLGLFAGFLPCPIVLAFLAYALQSGSVVTGMATMGALGVGTMLPLLAAGTASRLSGIHLRSWAPKASGIILITLGIATCLRGTTMIHHLLCRPSDSLAATGSTIPPAAGPRITPCCSGAATGPMADPDLTKARAGTSTAASTDASTDASNGASHGASNGASTGASNNAPTDASADVR